MERVGRAVQRDFVAGSRRGLGHQVGIESQQRFEQLTLDGTIHRLGDADAIGVQRYWIALRKEIDGYCLLNWCGLLRMHARGTGRYCDEQARAHRASRELRQTYRFRSQGSRASRRPSPTKLMAMTVTKI